MSKLKTVQTRGHAGRSGERVQPSGYVRPESPAHWEPPFKGRLCVRIEQEALDLVRRDAIWLVRTDTEVDSVEHKFARLRDEWKSTRGPASSSAKLAMHPAYQSIIGMGFDAVPFILRELAANLDGWFWALRAITEEDPVPELDRGNGEAMRQAWLKWGKDRGLIS